MSSNSQNTSFFKNHKWSTFLFSLLILLVLLIVLARALLGVSIEYFAKNWLNEQNIDADLGKIEIHLLQGTVSVFNFNGKNQQQQGFSLGELTVSWHWKPLLENSVDIKQININDLSLDSAFYNDGKIQIAGLTIPANTDKSSTPESSPKDIATVWNININNIALNNIKICTQQLSADNVKYDYCGRFSKLLWEGSVTYKLDNKASTEIPLYVDGNFNLQGFTLHNNKLALDLLSIKDLGLQAIQIKTTDNIHIKNLNIEELSALERKTENNESINRLVSFENLQINPIQLMHGNTLSIDRISLRNPQTYYYLDKEGHSDIDQWLPDQSQAKTESPEKPATNKPAEKNDFSYIIKQIDVTSDKTSTLSFSSVDEDVNIDIKDLKFKLDNLNSKKPEDPSNIYIEFTLGTHGHLKLEAVTTPLSPRLSMKGTANISGIDLRRVSPLARANIGYDIKSGQLDTEADINIDNGVIDSKLHLSLNHFNLKTLDKEQAKKLNSELGFPLSSSLSMLRDRDDKIKLTIPITGDIENPEFSPKDAIMKASSKAVTAAILHIYTPFGLVFAAESLFDLATGLYFDPVLFEPGDVQLTDKEKEQLDKLAVLMKDRPGIYITLCSTSNSKDLAQLRLKSANEPSANGDIKGDTVTEAETKELKALGELRSLAVKSYLVEKKSVEHNRLVECLPEYEKNGISGVEVSL